MFSSGGTGSGYVPFLSDEVEIDLNSIFFFNPASPDNGFSSTMWRCQLPVCEESYPGSGMQEGPGSDNALL